MTKIITRSALKQLKEETASHLKAQDDQTRAERTASFQKELAGPTPVAPDTRRKEASQMAHGCVISHKRAQF